MSGWGEFEFDDFRKYAEKINKELKRNTAEIFLRDTMNEVGRILLANVKENTPVGQYSDGWVEFVAMVDGKAVDVRFWASVHGKQGGNLRDGWFVGGAAIVGNSVTLTIYNNVEYASWVENGHRTRSGGWVEGQFFLKTTMEELNEMLSDIIEPKYIEFLESLLG